MHPLILNRDTASRVQPVRASWHQIEVSGRQPATLSDGREIVLDIDQAARRAIVEAFNRKCLDPDYDGMLVDRDHLSHNLSQTTEAMAWQVELKDRAGQICGLLDWTDDGATAVNGRAYKYFSTEYDESDLQEIEPGVYRPLRLSGLALTNRPRRKGGKAILANRAESSSAQPNPTTDTTMQTIAEKLGLAPDASEEDILAAIDALQTAADDAAAAQADAEAEAVLNRYADRIPQGTRDDWKAGLIANREQTEKLIAGLPEPRKAPAAPRAPITNRDRATVPATDRATGGDQAGTDEQRAREQQKAVATIKNRDRCSYDRAWDTAQREHPDLF